VVQLARQLLIKHAWSAGQDNTEWLNEKHISRTIRDSYSLLSGSSAQASRKKGKPHKKQHVLTEQQLDEAIAAVSKGCHPTMADAALHCRYIHDLLATAGCSTRYLWCAMCNHDPTFRKRGMVEPHRTITADWRKKRRDYILQMQRRAAADPTFLKRVCWVDQKQVYLVSSHQGFRRWCQRHGIEGPSQQDLVLECTHMDGKYRNWVVYYYAIVNAVLGPFYICMVTGTHGAGAPEFNFEASYGN
jgi:hypothetical protein